MANADRDSRVTHISKKMIKRQEMLLKKSIEKIEVAYLTAIRKKLVSPVVFVFDLYAPKSREVMQRMGIAKRTGELMKLARQQQNTPTSVVHTSSTETGDWLPSGHENIGEVIVLSAKIFEVANTFPVVLVGQDLVSLVQVPVPPVE